MMTSVDSRPHIPYEPNVKIVHKRIGKREEDSSETSFERGDPGTGDDEESSTKSSRSVYSTQIENRPVMEVSHDDELSGTKDSDSVEESGSESSDESGSSQQSLDKKSSQNVSDSRSASEFHKDGSIQNSSRSSEKHSNSSKSSATSRESVEQKGSIEGEKVLSVKQKKSNKDKVSPSKKKKSRTKSRTKRDGYSYALITGICLHNTSKLKFDSSIRRPRIKVSWYDDRKGQLVEKSQKKRNVILNYEPDNLDCIQPIISKHGRILNEDEFAFTWEETLILNEDFEFLKDTHHVLFFEVIDMKIQQSRSLGSLFSSCIVPSYKSGGWYRICWAFLRPFTDRSSSFDHRCKLQLYKYKKIPKKYSIYDQWSVKKKNKYPGTLDVTITSVKPTTQDVGFVRPHTALQEDKRRSPSISSSSSEENGYEKKDLLLPLKDSRNPLPHRPIESKWSHTWNLLKGGSYKTPDAMKNSRVSEKGSTACQFSFDGKLVAFSDHSDILVASVPDLKIVHSLKAHSGVVHSLQWQPGVIGDILPKNILSASEDRTCILWTLEKERQTLQVFPHPSFVYCAIFVSSSEKDIRIATAGRDSVLRIWRVDKKQSAVRLLQELNGHDSFIVGLCFSSSCEAMYSCDVDGTIGEWKLNDKRSWFFARKVAKIPEVVQQMHLHPKINRLYTLTNLSLYSIDIGTGLPRRTLIELVPRKTAAVNRFVISKCGAYLFVSTRDNVVTACNLIQETVVDHIFIRLPFNCFIDAIDWYPPENFLAVSVFGKQRGGFFLYSPSKLEETHVVTSDPTDNLNDKHIPKKPERILPKSWKHKKATEKPNWDLILERFDELFRANTRKSSNDTDDKKANTKIDEANVSDASLETPSIASNRTFTVSVHNEAGNTFKVDGNQGDNTFTIEPIRNSEDTDISESMDSSDEE